MNFYNTKLSPEIGLLNIGAFDIDNRADASKLKHIFRCLFQLNDRLFFSFRRHEDLTDMEALEKLKVSITKTFDNSGEYVVLDELDEIRFDSIAQLTVQDSTFDFLLDTWRYFYSCAFFSPMDDFTFSDFASFQKEMKFHDKGSEKLLNEAYAKFSCIKDLGGSNLIVSYRKDYPLPDLKAAVSAIRF